MPLDKGMFPKSCLPYRAPSPSCADFSRSLSFQQPIDEAVVRFNHFTSHPLSKM